ncbi:LysM peptidoglycan-binding domain-containing protein [Polyangium aurulentum]|uniref:LysM peptidoglycan-binding domain-containing protein n=1 Tax=Polyangium aurulentum TaxID=2567896 RepID=UPI00146C9C9D|nr:LysM domain-containing protein [Polyangium aurulentum]UQA58594.1 LysM peptidoglycan-binding domain-containing protein [Polyangium aurulentum]
MRAITLSYAGDPSWDTGSPNGEVEIPNEDTGDFMQTLSSLFGGGGNSAGGNSPTGGSLGEGLGALAGAGLGTLAGGAGAGIGASLGRMAGGAVERLVGGAIAPKPGQRQRRLSKRERKILADGQKMTQRTGNPAYAEEAALRVHRPAEYKRRRAAGTLPTRGLAAPPSTRPAPPPPSTRPVPRPSRPPPSRPAPRPSVATQPARPPSQSPPSLPEPPPFYDGEPGYEGEDGYGGEHWDEAESMDEEYNETAAPDPRPRPLRHVSVTPLPRAYMETLLREVPAARNLDPRLLRLVSGNASAPRDVSGVEPSTGTYHALPGETPHGIAKKLTGQVERVAELFAANPGKSESSPVWNIPPGWLLYDRETGAITTTRKYVVQSGDSPSSIAKKLGAVSRPKWFAELRDANPQKPVKNGNFVSLHAGEELGVPDAWPALSPRSAQERAGGLPQGFPPACAHPV